VFVDSRFTLVSLFRGSHFSVWIQELRWLYWPFFESGFKHYISKSFVACTLKRSRILTDLLNDLMMIKMNGPDCEGIGDQRWKDIIDRAFAEWHRSKDRQPGRSRCDARPDQKRKATDIKERISMPKGVKLDHL